ncbi:tetratricopeptide repeat protein [uncultured Holdemanella sp.]|uniref:tetratricopeptide repeat protein n=1 Tax=uncultured Holdemanella sp. TaxID=1763549 RepID=UPI0025F79EB3|nr:tetratricopeptide repeat protein [uncultured Holdemanella sp.]
MAFTIESSKQILDDYYDLTQPTYEDDIQLINALEYLIKETNNPEYMVELGGWYYGQKQFDLAEEYYLMAAKLDYNNAYECLGYIYYYGRVGQPDYEKAFHYYKLASDQGNLVAAYKLADMYKNGYYVQKDYPKYVQIIKDLYPKIQGATNTFDPVPEIYSRLAKIYVEEGNEDQAIQLLLIAKEFQSQRLIYSQFFGDLTIMKYIVNDLYSLIQFDPDYMDLFDLYYALQKPCKVAIEILGEDHIIEAKYEDGLFFICMDDKNYEDVDQFFLKAKINGEPLSTQYVNVNYIEILD